MINFFVKYVCYTSPGVRKSWLYFFYCYALHFIFNLIILFDSRIRYWDNKLSAFVMKIFVVFHYFFCKIPSENYAIIWLVSNIFLFAYNRNMHAWRIASLFQK